MKKDLARRAGACALVVWTLASVSPNQAHGQFVSDSLTNRAVLGGWALPVSGMTLAVGFMAMESDDDVRGWFQARSDGSWLRSVSGWTSPVGGAHVPFVLGGAALLSRVAGQQTISDVSWHTLRAVLATAVVTGLGKAMVGRERPGANEEWSWSPGAGFNDPHFRSLPSGHTAQAFALATALGTELRLHDVPGSNWLTPAFYGVAGLCGISRLVDDRHWSSDVIIGGLVGTLTARAALREHETRLAPVFAGNADGGVSVGLRWGGG